MTYQYLLLVENLEKFQYYKLRLDTLTLKEKKNYKVYSLSKVFVEEKHAKLCHNTNLHSVA